MNGVRTEGTEKDSKDIFEKYNRSHGADDTFTKLEKIGRAHV